MSAYKRAESQPAKFRKAARELGCDESEERFNASLDKVLKSPPAKQEKTRLVPKSK